MLHRLVNEVAIETRGRFLPTKYGTHPIAMHPEFVAEWSITKLMRDQGWGHQTFPRGVMKDSLLFGVGGLSALAALAAEPFISSLTSGLHQSNSEECS